MTLFDLDAILYLIFILLSDLKGLAERNPLPIEPSLKAMSITITFLFVALSITVILYICLQAPVLMFVILSFAIADKVSKRLKL